MDQILICKSKSMKPLEENIRENFMTLVGMISWIWHLREKQQKKKDKSDYITT